MSARRQNCLHMLLPNFDARFVLRHEKFAVGVFTTNSELLRNYFKSVD